MALLWPQGHYEGLRDQQERAAIKIKTGEKMVCGEIEKRELPSCDEILARELEKQKLSQYS